MLSFKRKNNRDFRTKLRAALAFLIVLAPSLVPTRVWQMHPAFASSPTPSLAEVKTSLKQSGFEPAEVLRDAGKFRLTVVNSSGTENLTFVVTRVGGKELYRSQPTVGHAAWSEEFDLPAGRYLLTEANHPA